MAKDLFPPTPPIMYALAGAVISYAVINVATIHNSFTPSHDKIRAAAPHLDETTAIRLAWLNAVKTGDAILMGKDPKVKAEVLEKKGINPNDANVTKALKAVGLELVNE